MSGPLETLSPGVTPGQDVARITLVLHLTISPVGDLPMAGQAGLPTLGVEGEGEVTEPKLEQHQCGVCCVVMSSHV